MSISVAMAACNGSNYLREQVESILPQLHSGDQLVISVDPSTDGTRELVEQLVQSSPLIELLTGPGKGISANFENAIRACNCKHIFLCDHDDVWHPNKVAKVLGAFVNSNAALVMHDAEVVDEQLRQREPSFFALRGSKPGYMRNIAKNSYIGCCMAFRRDLKQYILPLPANIPMHDQWIGLLAEKHGGVHFLAEPLIKYRRHSGNATAGSPAGLQQMVAWRAALLQELAKRDKELEKTR
jgi:glycosyltransferase involved in cell wall biosynthesis